MTLRRAQKQGGGTGWHIGVERPRYVQQAQKPAATLARVTTIVDLLRERSVAFPRRRLLFWHQDLHTNNAVLGVALQIAVSKKARQSQGREGRGLRDLTMLHWRQLPAVSMLSWLKECHISHLSNRVSFLTPARKHIGELDSLTILALPGYPLALPLGVPRVCSSHAAPD